MTGTKRQLDAICVGIRDRAARLDSRAWWVEYQDHGPFTYSHRTLLYPAMVSREAPTEPNLRVRR